MALKHYENWLSSRAVGNHSDNYILTGPWMAATSAELWRSGIWNPRGLHRGFTLARPTVCLGELTVSRYRLLQRVHMFTHTMSANAVIHSCFNVDDEVPCSYSLELVNILVWLHSAGSGFQLDNSELFYHKPQTQDLRQPKSKINTHQVPNKSKNWLSQVKKTELPASWPELHHYVLYPVNCQCPGIVGYLVRCFIAFFPYHI